MSNLRYSDYFSIFAELENKARHACKIYDIIPSRWVDKVTDRNPTTTIG